MAGKTKKGAAAAPVVRMAFIGYGIQARTVLVPNFIKQPNVVVKAVCDCDRVRRDAGTKAVNDYYKKNGKSKLAVCKAVADFRDIIKDKTGKEPLDAFTEAMNNIMPQLEVKARRVGGATYQVPIEVRPARRQTLALRWLVDYARKRNEKTMKERLAGEIMDACNNLGAAVKKREDMHKNAEANKAFAHFRW